MDWRDDALHLEEESELEKKDNSQPQNKLYSLKWSIICSVKGNVVLVDVMYCITRFMDCTTNCLWVSISKNKYDKVQY